MRVGRSIIFAAALSLSLAASALSQGTNQAISLFVKANDAYQTGKYDEAIQGYESIVRTKTASGPVFYNLGNAYFKKGQLGKAIVNYERARQLIPRDGDLESNYRYALSLVKKFSEEPVKNFWERGWESVMSWLNADEWAWITYAWLLVMVIGHLLSLWLRWPVSLRRAVTGVFLLVWVAHGLAFMEKLQGEERFAVAVSETKALFEPREESTVHFDVVEGGKVELLKTEGDWVKVRRPDGKMGWVRREAVEKI